MSSTLIQVQEVSKAFRTIRAVDAVSFEVKPGDIFALFGPNGAGKSTLVRMLIGMLPPDQGTIQWFDSQNQPAPFNPRRIGYLPEDRGLYRDQKVAHILEYFGQLRGLSRVDAHQAATEWAERLQVSQYLNSRLETLSKGNQQKVQVAASVLHRPELALLDEPFSGLDPLNQEMMLDVIRSLQNEGTTVLLSAHQLELVERLADRVFLMSKGRRVLDGTVHHVKTSVHGGYALHLRFVSPQPDNAFDDWKHHSDLTGFHHDRDTLRLTLQDQSVAADWVARAASVGQLAEFRGGLLSLHEIYLRALHSNIAQSEKMLATV